MNIGEKIKFFRKEKGMTQLDLANKSGIQVRTIQRYEAGNSRAKYNVLNQIAKALNIPVQCFSSIDELLTQQAEYIMSLSVGQRITVFRLCSGYSTETLAEKIVSDIYSECTDENVSTDDSAYEEDVKSINLELHLIEAYHKTPEQGYMSNLASVLGIPVELLCSDVTKSDSTQKQSSDNLEKYDDTETDKKTELVEKIDQIIRLLNNNLVFKELSPEFQQYYSKLNSEGKQKLLDYAKDLSQLEKYTAPDPDSENEE